MTMTLNISEDVLRQLEEEAQQAATSPEEVALTAITEHLQR